MKTELVLRSATKAVQIDWDRIPESLPKSRLYRSPPLEEHRKQFENFTWTETSNSHRIEPRRMHWKMFHFRLRNSLQLSLQWKEKFWIQIATKINFIWKERKITKRKTNFRKELHERSFIEMDLLCSFIAEAFTAQGRSFNAFCALAFLLSYKISIDLRISSLNGNWKKRWMRSGKKIWVAHEWRHDYLGDHLELSKGDSRLEYFLRSPTVLKKRIFKDFLDSVAFIKTSPRGCSWINSRVAHMRILMGFSFFQDSIYDAALRNLFSSY